MWFGEPHPFPERESPTRLSASGQQSYEGWSCRTDMTNLIVTFRNFSNSPKNGRDILRFAGIIFTQQMGVHLCGQIGVDPLM